MNRTLPALLTLFVLPACPAVVPDEVPPPDLLVVVLDTTTPQLVAEVMPNAQAFVDAGRSWDRAVAPSNTTVDSVGGVMQDRFLLTTDLAPGADSTSERTLAERLSEAGWSTLMASGNEALDHELFARGFDRVSVRERSSDGDGADEDAVDFFLTAWAELPPPRFGWLQLNAGHDYLGAPDDAPWPPVSPDELTRAWGWYADDASAADAMLPSVFALVPPEAGLTALTADHGEHFSDRGPNMVGKPETFGHGEANASMELHVPLALQGRGVEPGAVVSAASILDLHPTLLAAAGLDTRADLRSGEGLRPAGASICNLLNLELSEESGNMSVLVHDDGSQLVRTHSPAVLPPSDRPPLLVRWPAMGRGLQQNWTELALSDVSAAETAFLFDESLPECKGFADLCEEYPELGAIGYIDCD